MTARDEEHFMTNFIPSLRRMAALGAGLAGALMAGAASAHPGHGAGTTLGFVDGLVHLLTEPDHVAMLVLAVVAGVAGAKAWRARRAARRADRPHRR
ncbi:MAG: HupE/UreJ family protein [Burkholderiaceae bacterium]